MEGAVDWRPPHPRSIVRALQHPYDGPLAAIRCRTQGRLDQSDYRVPRRSRTPEKSQVEGHEDQDDANIHYQPFPESISEEHEIHTDYHGCHRHHVNHHRYRSAHLTEDPLDWTHQEADIRADCRNQVLL